MSTIVCVNQEDYLMKLILGLILTCVLSTVAFASPYYSAQTPVHVSGYTRSNGTQVHSYYRAEPGQAKYNHY